MRKKIYNWGVLGTSKISKTLIPVIKESGHIVYCIASRSEARVKKISKKYNISKFYNSYDQMLRDKNLDIIYVPLPNSEHYKWIIKSLLKNKHILCEKPICTSIDHIDNVIKKAKEKNLMVSEALMYRHHPLIKKLLRLIKDKKIGNIRSLKGKFYYKINNKRDIRFKKELDGGSMWDLGYYVVSLINYLITKKITKVYGKILKKYNSVDSKFYGKIFFDKNTFAEFHSSFENNKNDSVEITGTKGTIYINSAFLRNKNKKIILKLKNNKIIYTFKELKHRYLYQIEDYVESIRKLKKPEVTLNESKKNIRITNLLLLSANQQKEILN